MSPPRPPGPGRVGPAVFESPVVSAIDTPAPVEAPPPRRRLASLSSIAARLRPRPLSLNKQTIIVVFNPTARDGRIGGELPELLRTLRGAGAHVIPVETVPDLEERRQKIREATAAALQDGRKIFVLPFGGDGTIGETVGEVLRAAGTSFAPGQESAPNVEAPSGRAIFVLARKGTAADLAVQVDAPSKLRDLPRFIARSVELGFRFPIIDGAEAGTHSMGILASGYLFTLRQQNRAANPTSFLNQGIWSYLRLLPHAIANRFGLIGVDVTLTRSTAEGKILERTTVTGAEVTVTPNRILAGVGGVPGAWGETKVVVLPPGARGVLPLSEYIGRGLLTKLGLNLVGPRSRLWSLAARRQWVVNRGETIEVKATVPDTLPWDLIRTYQDWMIRQGKATPDTRVPAAGEPLQVPAVQNGDVVASRSGFTVHAPTFTITKLADPDSLAVRLARASWLVRREVPMISDQQMVFNQVPDHEPRVLENGEGRRTVRTPFISLPRLRDLMRRYRVAPERAEALLASAQGTTSFAQLERLASEHLTIENLESWLQSETGQRWAEEHREGLRGLRERTLRGGPPLALGLASLLGAERLADIVGLDPVRQRELRFAFVVYLSHAVSANAHTLWQVAANRMLSQPYHLSSIRTVRVAGERLAQWTFLERPSLTGAMGEGLLRRVGWEAGFARGLLRRGFSLATLLPRAAWNMGEGLLFSRVAERLVHDLPEDSTLRRYAPSAAFFLPDLVRIAAPARTISLLEARPMRFATRAFALGFLSDLSFTGLHRLYYGETATYESWMDYRSAELRRQRGEISPFSWRQIPRFLAPSLSAFLDSHDYGFGSPNEARRELLRSDREQSRLAQDSIRADLQWLPGVLGSTASDLFQQEIRLNEVEREMLEQLEQCRGRGQLPADAGLEATAVYLQQQFRGVVRSREEATEHLLRLQAHRIQQTIRQLQQVEIPENQEIRQLFDERGRLRPGQREALQAWLRPERISGALPAVPA